MANETTSTKNKPATKYVPCPNCQSTNVQKLKYTWWGGALGSLILTHIKCNDCGTTYTEKTGKSNTVGIVIYSVIVIIIFILITIIAFNYIILRNLPI